MRKRALAAVVALVGTVGLVVPATVSPAAAAPCTNPKFTTSDPNGMQSFGKYVVHNNMWNVDSYNVSETLRACSYKNWIVQVTADNSSGDGAVKTYPNVHVDFHDWGSGDEPQLSSFSRIRSSFASRTPGVGIYDAAYDIWLNGVPGEYEVMIWTDNLNQVPAGSKVASGLRFSGHTWDLWATDGNNILSFVPEKRLNHGTVGLKQMLSHLVREGRVPGNATLGQICFGFEVVSTDGKAANFKVKDFKLKTATY